MELTRRANVRLSETMMEAAQREADRRGISLSELVRVALERELER